MLNAVDDLIKAKPHMRPGARFTIHELHAYHEGYYAGLGVALHVLSAAIENYKLVTRTRRASRAAKKTG